MLLPYEKSGNGTRNALGFADHSVKACMTVGVIPFIVVLLILLFGAVTAVETINSPPDQGVPTVERPTSTPRPRPTSPRPSETPEPTPGALVAPASTPRPTAVPVPAATPTPNAQALQSMMRVGNTDREGVFIRSTPNLNDKIRPWMDGTPMTVVGQPETVGGITWLKVRAPDGVEGYVPSQYLVP
jgi:hypothetical protein